jgi:methionine synthase I (cobalamin-dependent)
MKNNNGKILITESELRALIREEIEAALDEGLLDFLKPSPMMQVSKAAAEVTKKLKPVYDALKKKGVDAKILDTEETTNAIRAALKTAKGATTDDKIADLAKKADVKAGKVVFN